MTVYHTYYTKVSHHEYKEIDVDIEACRDGGDPIVSMQAKDGSKSRITLNLGELRELVQIGERFQKSHQIMEGNYNDE